MDQYPGAERVISVLSIIVRQEERKMKRFVAAVLSVLLLFSVSYADLLNYDGYSDEDLESILVETQAEIQRRKAGRPDVYTAAGSLYVLPGNPNMVNYQYSQAEADSLVPVIQYISKTDRVLESVLERLYDRYSECAVLLPENLVEFIRSALTIEPLPDVPNIILVKCSTDNPVLSWGICNSFIDVAPVTIQSIMPSGVLIEIDRPQLSPGSD